MAFALGEVRYFATGVLESVSFGGLPGTYQAQMQTIQKVWDGEQWCEMGTPECGAVLSKVYKLPSAA